MKLGSLDITAISDGVVNLPAAYFPNADWEQHKALLNADGNIPVPIGCFLIRTNGQNILIDAGLGPIETPFIRGGDLLKGLAAEGLAPDDIDLLIATHVHLDHVGWVFQNGALTFPNATLRIGIEDTENFSNDPFSAEYAKHMYEALNGAGRLEPIDRDGEIVPGISALHAPGHTLGHRALVLSSGDERAYLLGDAVTCPIQLQETDWEAMSDVDPKLAKRTRETLWKELEGQNVDVVAAHFPGLQFGRILKGEGKRYFA